MDERASDEELMAAVRRGELPRLATLFERHSRRLFGFLRGLVGSATASEDLVQETFLRVLRHRRTYRTGKPFLPWLLGIARNAARAHISRTARMPRSELPELIAAGTPERRQLERERAGRLAHELQRLALKDREVLLLSYFEGLDHRQIGELVGASPGAVKVRAHRARKALRARLAAPEKSP